jgi:hypothetical protein
MRFGGGRWIVEMGLFYRKTSNRLSSTHNPRTIRVASLSRVIRQDERIDEMSFLYKKLFNSSILLEITVR